MYVDRVVQSVIRGITFTVAQFLFLKFRLVANSQYTIKRVDSSCSYFTCDSYLLHNIEYERGSYTNNAHQYFDTYQCYTMMLQQ